MLSFEAWLNNNRHTIGIISYTPSCMYMYVWGKTGYVVEEIALHGYTYMRSRGSQAFKLGRRNVNEQERVWLSGQDMRHKLVSDGKNILCT